MAKSSNQKLKLLYLREMLEQRTDEQHPMTVAEMIEGLSAQGIAAERKSIYDDLEALRTFGLDILQTKSKTTGHYIASREFELPELKLLVDSVQSSQFITHKKTLSLIKKIENLTSVSNARLLQRQVYVQNRVKTMNESVYYNVDELSAAIARERQIRFRYFEYTVAGERRFRHDGTFYIVSPYALMWDSENYYLLGFDAAAGRMKHYRVDKMTEICGTETPREGAEVFAALDLSAYSSKVFGMFGGELQRVQLRFASHLAGAVIDRFGKEVHLFAEPDGRHFTVAVTVAVSPQFFAWVFGFGGEAEIMSPSAVREQMRQQLQQTGEQYQSPKE